MCKGNEIEENHGHHLIANDIKMIVQYKNSNSRFGVSPFAIGMTHQDAPLEAQLALQVALNYMSNEDMDRYCCVEPIKK